MPEPMSRLLPPTIDALHEVYRQGTWRPSEVVEHWLARPATDRDRPVWISTFAAAALRERGAELDARLARSVEQALASPVFGALCAVKDNIDVAGLPTTAACPAFAFTPSRDAAAVASLVADGAIVLGKTNLDQFATGLVGTRSPYGAVPNAFDARYVSGGSSSGSAVAVARGLVHFALGTDTAGSGRIPAGLNNIVGWKPTLGLISTEGVLPACRSLDCVSVFALTVSDASRAIASMAGATHARALDRPGGGAQFAFAVPRRDQLEFFGDARSAAAFAAALERLADAGGTPRDIDFAPWRAVASMLYEGPHVAERHAAIRAFFDREPDALDPTVRGIIAGARRFSATDVFVAEAALAQARATLASLWNDVDVLVVPTAPTVYALADVAAEPVELNRRLGTYTNFVNLLDLAAIAVPQSLRDDGLPFGITLIGPAGSDLALARIAQRLHAASGLPLGALGRAQPAPSRALAPRPDTARLAVVGAHLTGLPLHHELTARGARLVTRTRTAPVYRLFALPGTTPPKPGMVRVPGEGAAIEVEVWELSHAAFGSFVANVPPPLCIGSLELDDGTRVHGFLCESAALVGADDITRFGGWRAYLSSRATATPAPASLA